MKFEYRKPRPGWKFKTSLKWLTPTFGTFVLLLYVLTPGTPRTPLHGEIRAYEAQAEHSKKNRALLSTLVAKDKTKQ